MHGKLFEIIEWIESGKPTLIPYDSKRRHSLIYQAIQRGNHSMIVYLVENAEFLPWETENLIGWAGGLTKDLRAGVISMFLDKGIPLGSATANDIFPTFDDDVIDRALKQGLSLRDCEGFADVLIETNVARPLLRYFRAYRKEYPDLEVEAIIATKWFVKQKRKKACALLGWVGVDTNRPIDDDSPYEPPEDNFHKTILDEVRLDADTEEILKLLKIKVTEDVWWHFFQFTVWLYPQDMKRVLNWIKDPEKIIQSNPKQAEEVLDYALRYYSLKDWHFVQRTKKQELEIIQAAQHLILFGTTCLLREPRSYRDYRSPMYASEHEEEVAKLCWLMYECGDEDQKQRVYNLVKTPQLKRLVNRHESAFIRILFPSKKNEAEAEEEYQKLSQKRISEMDMKYFSSLKTG